MSTICQFSRRAYLNHSVAAIAAYLAKGQSVPEAVSAGFGFIGTMLKAGDLFD